MEFPITWEVSALGSLFDTITGSTPPKSQKDNYGDDVPFVKPPELQDCEIGDTGDNLSIKGASASRTVPPGSILISCIGNLGKVGITEDTVAFNQQINAIKYKKNFVPKFVFYQALSPWFKHQLESLASGTTVPIVNKSKFNSIQVGFPPIPEQKRIVAILDQAFADIDKARALTEKNLKNARELFESYLQQVFSRRRDGWKTSKLKSIASKIGSGATPKGGKAAYKAEGISLIRSMNVHDRRFLAKDLAFIDDDQAEKLSNVVVEKNDVLLNITGASVARCALAPEKFLPARVNQHVSIIRVNQKELLPAFLNYALTSKFYKDQLLGIGESGSTRQAITKNQIEEFEVSYPLSIDQQTRYVQQLELLESQVQEVQCIFEKKLDSLDELKKSVLQKAFVGELTKDNKEAAA